jgi:hypothetical protein
MLFGAATRICDLSTITESEQLAALECITAVRKRRNDAANKKKAAGPKPRRRILLAMPAAC